MKWIGARYRNPHSRMTRNPFSRCLFVVQSHRWQSSAASLPIGKAQISSSVIVGYGVPMLCPILYFLPGLISRPVPILPISHGGSAARASALRALPCTWTDPGRRPPALFALCVRAGALPRHSAGRSTAPFARRMLQNSAPCSRASSSATCVCGSGSCHSSGRAPFTQSR